MEKYEEQCSTVNEQVCNTVNEQQCSTVQEQQCRTVQDTVNEQVTSTFWGFSKKKLNCKDSSNIWHVFGQVCNTVNEQQCNTVQEQQCSTVNEQVLYSS